MYSIDKQRFEKIKKARRVRFFETVRLFNYSSVIVNVKIQVNINHGQKLMFGVIVPKILMLKNEQTLKFFIFNVYLLYLHKKTICIK